MLCWIQALTPMPCIMSNSMYRAIQNNINESNPFQSNITPHPYDLSSQLMSPPITANSLIGSPLPEDKPDNVFCLLCGNPNGFNLAPEEAISSTIARKSIDFKQILHASMSTISIHTITQLKASCTKPHNVPLIIPNLPPPAVLFQQHPHSNQAAL